LENVIEEQPVSTPKKIRIFSCSNKNNRNFSFNGEFREQNGTIARKKNYKKYTDRHKEKDQLPETVAKICDREMRSEKSQGVD
jgi:hypothetical protein